jgi:uncharacterized surface protein with fasciclin (FAS1) repeats
MGPGTFLIAILGCGEAEAPCQQVRMLAPTYQSEAACTAATDSAILRNSDVDFPVVVAQCVAAGDKPQPLKASQVKRPEGGEAKVRVSPLRT